MGPRGSSVGSSGIGDVPLCWSSLGQQWPALLAGVGAAMSCYVGLCWGSNVPLFVDLAPPH